MYKVFIDGQEGTTGLEIRQHLARRKDVELLLIDEARRKDLSARKEYINAADVAILCLPDDMAKQSVGLLENSRTKIIDASTAHRTSKDWVYGLPELPFGPDGSDGIPWSEKIAQARFVANPGCYPTGFVLMVNPLVARGMIPRDYPAVIHALSGYSGGGKKLIAAHSQPGVNEDENLACRPYGFAMNHKHLPEMKHVTGLSHLPLFCPSVGHFYRGMLVHVPLFSRLLEKHASADSIRAILAETYANEPFVRVMEPPMNQYLAQGFLSPLGCNHTNRVDIFVWGNEDQILLTARLDNLGKGASGAAVQNLNLMLGCEPEKGLAVTPAEFCETAKSAGESISAGQMPIIVYTDGSSIQNPGPGGYGVVIQAGGATHEFSEGYVHTTNNRMEMMAVICALEQLHEHKTCQIIIHSDSQYTINGIVKGWARSWKKKNWKKSDGKPALNPDLWAKLLDLTESFSHLRFKWVKGHAGDPLNERADTLANQAARQEKIYQHKDKQYLAGS